MTEANISKIAEFGKSQDGQATSWSIFRWTSSELVLAERHRGVRRFRPTPGTIHPTIPSTHPPTGPHESVLLNSPGSDRDGAPIHHPLAKLEKAIPEELTQRNSHRHSSPPTGKPIEDVIRRVLGLANAQSMSMTTLQRALPAEEENRFW